MTDIFVDEAALERIGAGDIVALTEAATRSYFYRDGLTPQQLAANDRIVAISAEYALRAIVSPRQHFAAAIVGGAFAGYVIATVHGADDLELDWMMVHPHFHGSGVAQVLMNQGLAWLGLDRPIWLNVIQHNQRAISFYRKFGFEIDPDARTRHVVPHFIMRRKAALA